MSIMRQDSCLLVSGHGRGKRSWPMLAAALAMLVLCNRSVAGAEQAIGFGSEPTLTFAPNQLAANAWYRPNGNVINGHFDTSFAHAELWPRLRDRLIQRGGGLGIPAAEIGYLPLTTIDLLRAEGLHLSVEMPGMTQCDPGEQIADFELFGKVQPDATHLRAAFALDRMHDRPSPIGRGWLRTRDGHLVRPDEIVLDERIPALLPDYDLASILAKSHQTSLADAVRLAEHDTCSIASSFHPGLSRLDGLIEDYVDYSRVLVARFSNPPALSLHWNVTAGWEWRDKSCLTKLADQPGGREAFERRYRYLTDACHADTAALTRLLDRMCAASRCPFAVYIDMDLTYLTSYALGALRRDRAVIRNHHVAFGIDLTDECGVENCEVAAKGGNELRLSQQAGVTGSDNRAMERAVLTKLEFLQAHGIIDSQTAIRIQSWTPRPHEIGMQVAEARDGSFANTALRVMERLAGKLHR